MTLLLLVLVPLVGAAATLVASRAVTATRTIAIASAAVSIVLAAVAWSEYALGSVTLTFGDSGDLGSMLALIGDGLSLPLVALTALLTMAAVLAGLRAERLGSHLALILGLEAAVTAVFLAGDLVLLYVAWEAVLIPMFFLIGGWGHENRRYAAMKFFLYTFAGSALMLVGIIALVLGRDGNTAIAPGAPALAGSSQGVVFWLLAAGFLVKVPVWPLHTWLPDAHVEAPTGGSILLAGVLLKMGGYGLVRVCMPLTPDAFERYARVLAVLGVIGIVYGAAMALAQSDLKRLIAYSSVAHMGFVVLALSTGSALGLQAALLGMVSHGLVSGMLFFLAGAIHDRTHTRELAALGGLGRATPLWSVAFVFASLASLGLPGLSGFPGEFGGFVASFVRYGWPTAIAGVGVLLAGAYSLRAVRAVVHGPTREGPPLTDLGWREIAAIVPLALLVLALGVWPRLVTDFAQATIEAVVSALTAVTS